MNRSDSINELAAALAKAQAGFAKISRDKTARVRMRSGGEYTYDFADLESVLDAVRPSLSSNGLSLTFDCATVFDPLRVSTRATLLHSSGQYMTTAELVIPCSADMAAPQAIGSACTYGRRYAIQALLGISTDRDEDGSAAGGAAAEVTQRQRQAAPPPKAAPKPGKLHGPLATWLGAFGWPANERRDRAEFLLAHAGATFEDCCNPTIGGRVLAALQQRLAEVTVGDMTEAQARESLFTEAMQRAADNATKGAK